MKKKICFILPPVILAVTTLVWLFYKEGRWYTYRNELPFYPLMALHFLLPVFYNIAFIVSIIRQIRKGTRSRSNIVYIIASAVLTVLCYIGAFFFLAFTSGM